MSPSGLGSADPEVLMTIRNQSRFARHSRIFAQTAGVLVAVLGGAALIGWWLKIEALRCVVPGSAPLKPNIAAGFLLCGVALALLSRPTSVGDDIVVPREANPEGIRERSGVSRSAVRMGVAALAVMVMALAVLTIGGYFFNWNLGIDQWLVRDFPATMGTAHPGRMLPTTALCFLLTGGAIFAEAQMIPTRLRLPLVAGASATLVILGVITLGGFFLEKWFGPQWNLLGMSISGVSAVVGFMILGAGFLALARREDGLMWSLDAVTTTGFAIGILLTVLTTASAFTFAKQMLETNTWVTHRQDVLKQLQHCMTGMAELASGERVYAIMGDERLLKEREQTSAAVKEDLRDVRRLTADNPNQQRRLDRLEPLIERRIDWEEKVIAARRQQGAAKAAEMIATGPGLGLSKELGGAFKQIQDEEYGLLRTDRKRAEAASVATFLLLPLGVLLSLAVLSLCVFFLNAGVAERVQSENALRESEAQLQTIVENLDEGVIVSNLDGQLLQWNRAALKLHGYSDSDQDRRRFTELIDTFELSTLDGAPVPVEQWPLARVLRGEKVHDLELRVRRIGRDWQRTFSYGGTLVHDANNRPLMAIVTVGDITERKRAEEMLRGSEERYRSLFESNPNPMWVFDVESLSFLAVNAAAVRHYGYSQEEFLAMSLKEIRPPEDVSVLMEDLALETPGLGAVTEWRHRKKNGELIDVEITSHALVWLGRRAKLVLVNDITARKRAEREIGQLNLELEERVKQRTADLEAANKELEAFSYSVSHDLRAPLRAVDGFSQAVLEDYGAQLPEEGRHYLQTVRDGAQRMGVLIDDLLTFSRLSRLPLHKQPVSMTVLARQALEELNGQRNGRNIDIRIGDLPSCEGDPALLKQVWMNLLSNAIKYTRKREMAVVDIGSRQENGENVYSISDNGTGFDMKYAPKLFGVFQRLHRADEFEGTGVGLAIVQRVVHRHGGRIWAQAAVDRGAEFYFTLERTTES
jgi:PAS domain S-box-containing protein